MWYQPPPPTGRGAGEGWVGGDDRKLTAYNMTLPCPPSNTHSTTNPEGGRVNLVWGKGAKTRAPRCKGGGGGHLLHHADKLLHWVDKLYHLGWGISPSKEMATSCATYYKLRHWVDKLLHQGKKLILQEWWLLHAHGDTMNKCYKETSRTPWLGGSPVTQLLGEDIQIADGGTLPRV